MFDRNVRVFLVLLSMVGNSGFAAETPTAVDPAATTQAAAPSEVTPEGVLNKIHAINQMEIQMGELAKGQSKNRKIKKYAERMIKDHTKADKEVLATAKKDNLAIGEAAHDPEDMAEMDRLKGLAAGVAFESEYLKSMQAGHTKAIAYLTDAESKLTDDKTKKLISKLLPKIKDHEKEAVKLEKSL